MFRTDEQIQTRLDDPRNLARVEPLYRGGKTPGSGIPDKVKLLIGLVTRESGPTVAAREFGVSKVHAATLGKGQTDPKNLNPDLRERLDTLSGNVQENAIDKLCRVLNIIDPDGNEAQDLKIGQKASLAKDLATVVDKLSPRDARGLAVQQNAFIVYAPGPQEKPKFDVIELNPR